MLKTYRRLSAELKRSPEMLVPEAFQYLWTVTRFLVAYGGRASAKSWSIARVLVMLAHEVPLRILCTREIQGSIRESAYRLLVDQIHLLGLDDEFEIQADSIIHKNGSRFFFEGLRYNTSRIRSYESIDVCWVEEAQSVSELSWETLLPTVRKPGSRFFISFNPMDPADPVLRRFVDVTPPGCVAKKVSYLDNPHFSPESEAERAWLEQTDPDAYRHVWLGEPRTISDALVFRGKFAAEAFEIDPRWAGPFHGVDFGFSKDPSAGIRCYIDDESRVLYISKEFWRLGCDIDALPAALEDAIPEIARHVVYCDNSRPETISYLSRNGIPNARSAEKWPGSVDDGVMYLRAFARIVVDPSCTHALDELRSYSFKIDRMSGQPLPQVEDRHNHILDALRYSVHTLIRNQNPDGYFSRTAMLEHGAPVDPPSVSQEVFAVLVTTERAGTAAALVIFASSPSDVPPRLTICDWDMVEVEQALSVAWLESAHARLLAAAKEYRALMHGVLVVERNDFGAAALRLCGERLEQSRAHMLREDEILPTIDERAAAIRSTVNRGQVKLSRTAFGRQTTFRSTRACHFLSQVLGYRTNAKDAAQELVAAFTVGVGLWSPPCLR